MIWNIGGNMKRIINLVFTLIVSILLLVACDAATGSGNSNSNNNNNNQEQPKPDDNNSENNNENDNKPIQPEEQTSAEPGTIEESPLIPLAKALEEINPKDDEIVMFYYRPDSAYSAWGVWMWETGGDGAKAYDDISAGGGFKTITAGDKVYGYLKFNSAGTADNGCIALSGSGLVSEIAKKGTINFIVRDGNWAKDPGNDQSWDLSVSPYFCVLSGEAAVFAASKDASSIKPQITTASMLTTTTVEATLSVRYGLEKTASSNGFVITASDGTTVSVKDVKNFDYKDSNDRSNNYAKKLYIETETEMDVTKIWKIKHSSFIPEDGCNLSTGTAVKADLETLLYDGNDLGLTLNGSKATFKIWAPLASSVNVLLYNDYMDASTDSHMEVISPDDNSIKGSRHPMTVNEENGVWTSEELDVTVGQYYTYEITNLGTTYRVCDINALCAAPDSVAAQIVDIKTDSNTFPTGWAGYQNPWGDNGTTPKKYTEAVIYEIHIRDWSRAFVKDSTGTFADITNALKDGGAFAQHLNDLGITHVQILPMFDHAEKVGAGYNWGYNPYQYNVPETRYVKDIADGRQAVLDMRAMIQAFHNAGIAVNMDVVYNHTSGTKTGSLYDMTVPYYYYRLVNGEYSNGSGCGNETDSSAPMFKKYMIDSLKHWMTDYHINGFRFDLMGLHETSTMKDIYDALKEIDSNVMVYGEPWTGGTAAVSDGVTKTSIDNCSSSTTENGVACFNDNYRNGIKGAEFGGFKRGHVQGSLSTKEIIAGVLGSSKKFGTSSAYFTDVVGRSLNYVECHDNYTLYDKLVISLVCQEEDMSAIGDADLKKYYKAQKDLTDAQLTELKKQNKLCAALIFLAQGTPFINGGQEFMRTKQGDHNSYMSSDEINQIDLSFKTTNSDVYNTYKALISLRKDFSAFTNATNAVCKAARDENDEGIVGILKYAIEGTNGNFAVYINANDEEDSVRDGQEGYQVSIDEATGEYSIATEIGKNFKIPAKGFLIVKTN